MIIIHVVTKVIKWTVIVVAYLLVGLAKLVTILLVLLFLTGRAGIRRLLDDKGRRAEADEPDEYDLGYPPTSVAPRHRDTTCPGTPSTRGGNGSEISGWPNGGRAGGRQVWRRVVSGRSDADYRP